MTIGLRRNAYIWGNLINPNSTEGPGAMSASTTWTAAGFFIDRTRTLNKVRLLITKSGSPVVADMRADLYASDSAGNPNIGAGSLGTFGTASATSGFVEWSGLSVSVTAHQQYWIVLRNLNGTPGTNNYQYLAPSNEGAPSIITGQRAWGFGGRRSTNSGTSWSAQGVSLSGIRLEFADGYFDGIPITGTNSNATIFGSREAGAYFLSPSVDLQVRGLSMLTIRSGTPTGQLRYRIYLGTSPSLLATTQLFPTSAVNEMIGTGSYGWIPLFFSDVQTIPANSVVRVVASETTQSDASGNRFQVRSCDVDNDSNSKALMGSIYRTLSTDGGASFAETDTETVPFALIIDPEGLPGVPGSETGLVTPRKLSLWRYRRGHL